MRAMAFAKHGDLNVLQMMDLPVPEIADDEVLVQVKACALNHLDVWVREGIPGVQPMPHIGGCEAAGVVAKLGSRVRGFQEGQRVLIAPGLMGPATEWGQRGQDNLEPGYRILGYQTQGGLAEYAKASAVDVLSISDAWSFAEWAAVPLTFVTAWNMLHERARMEAGDDVLVLGASSGVGVAGIQIAKHGGARVFAVAGSPEKLKKAEELGADSLINYNTQDIAKEVRKLTNGRGVDIVFEHVGAALFPAALKSLARNGRIVTCGATTGPKVEIDLRFFFTQQIVITGAYMGSRHHLQECLKLVDRRIFRPVVDSTFPLDQTRAAQDRLQKREMFGKIVVLP